MELCAVFIILIISSINCIPIEYSTDLLLSVPSQNSVFNDESDPNNEWNSSECIHYPTFTRKTLNDTPEMSSKPSVHDDVEWIETSTKPEKQMVLGPVGTIVDMILSVSWIFIMKLLPSFAIPILHFFISFNFRKILKSQFSSDSVIFV